MHNLRLATAYKIITIQVAVRADLLDAEITGGLNEMLRCACRYGRGIADDWQFLPSRIPDRCRGSEYEIRYTDKKAPAKGELFSAPDKQPVDLESRRRLK